MEFSEVHELEHNGMPSFFNGLANIECQFSWMHSICCVAKGTILDECFNLLGTSRQDGQRVLAASDVSDAVYTWVSFQIFVLLVIFKFRCEVHVALALPTHACGIKTCLCR